MSRRTALVTGCTGGIGSAIVHRFRHADWAVIGLDRRTCPKELGLDEFLEGDVSSSEIWQQAADVISHGPGHPEALVNNAAVQICKPLVETSSEEWDAVMGSNLKACYLSVRQLHKFLRDGAIVNLSSVHALATSANIAAYAASKGGVLALTRALAIELAPSSVRVNAVLPGAVDTDMLQSGLARDQFGSDGIKSALKGLANKIPAGRIGRPEEIAETVYFLADAQGSSFITGQTIVVDGGAMARLGTE